MGETMVRERPILFSGEMVHALLDGRKTQTRRVVSDGTSLGNYRASELLLNAPGVFVDQGPSPAGNAGPYLHAPLNCAAICRRRGWPDGACDPSVVERLYPRWEVGDRLWVREAWQHLDSPCADEALTVYRATDAGPNGESAAGLGWRPSIHMPRWASRITLEVEDVDVQRVQEIAPWDVVAEGVDDPERNGPPGHEAVQAFRELWDSLNAARGYGWDVNPWVWALTFRRVEADDAA